MTATTDGRRRRGFALALLVVLTTLFLAPAVILAGPAFAGSGSTSVYDCSGTSWTWSNPNKSGTPDVWCDATIPNGDVGTVTLKTNVTGAGTSVICSYTGTGATSFGATTTSGVLCSFSNVPAGAHRFTATHSTGSTLWVSGLDWTSTLAPAPDTTPPTAPGTLTATQSGGDVLLSWGASTDAEGVTGYQWRVDAGAWTTVSGSTLTATSSGTGYGDHTFQVRAFDAATNLSTVTEAVYDGVHPVTGYVPAADPEDHPRCSVLIAGYDSSFHENVRVYVRCLTTAGAPTTWAALGANRVSVKIAGWLTTADRDAGNDPITCGIGQVDAWATSPTTFWSTTTAEVSFLIGAGAPENFRISAGLTDCAAWAVGGGHASITGGVGGLVGAANIVGNVAVGVANWLGGNGFCYGTVEAGQQNCTGMTGSDVILGKVTEASYPYEDGTDFPMLDHFGLTGGTSQHDPNVYVDTRPWDETLDGEAGATEGWGGGDFGGDYEECGEELCFSNGLWGNGYGVGNGPDGYVPGSPTNVTPDDPDPDFTGCDFSILDPGTYMCGLAGLFGKFLDVLRAILSWLQALGSFLLGLFVPDADVFSSNIDEVKTAFDGSALGTLSGAAGDIAAPITGLESTVTGCDGVPVTIPLEGDDVTFHPLSTCNELVATTLGWVMPIWKAFLYLGTVLVAGRVLGRAFGVETPGSEARA